MAGYQRECPLILPPHTNVSRDPTEADVPATLTTKGQPLEDLKHSGLIGNDVLTASRVDRESLQITKDLLYILGYSN